MIGWGVGLALCAALTHTAIDSTRKYASSVLGISAEGLVAVPALLDAVLACTGVALSGHLQRGWSTLKHPGIFVSATIASSLLLLVSRYMYQRAIFLSPLSLTIPYLAFTPAILILTAYVFLNELPSPSGVVGVMVVTLGGYLLNRVGSGAPPAVPKLDMLLPSLNGKPSASGVTAAVAAAADAVLLPTCGLRLQRNSSVTLGLLPPVDLEAQAPLGVGMSSSGGGGAVAGGTGVPVKRYAAAAGLKQRRSVSMSDLLKAPLMAIQLRQEPGTILMIAVAIIWSVTASLDKLGVITGPSIWAYFAAQRAAIGLASLAYILTRQPRLLLLLRDRLPLLLAVSALELASVVLFLLAVQHLLVSYVVAIKRSNVLFSVALGALLFGESVGSRMPYIGLMVAGMLLIVLEPSPGLGLVKSHT